MNASSTDVFATVCACMHACIFDPLECMCLRASKRNVVGVEEECSGCSGSPGKTQAGKLLRGGMCIRIHTYIHTYTHTYTYIHKLLRGGMCIRIHTYIHTHTHIHTYTSSSEAVCAFSTNTCNMLQYMNSPSVDAHASMYVLEGLELSQGCTCNYVSTEGTGNVWERCKVRALVRSWRWYVYVCVYYVYAHTYIYTVQEDHDADIRMRTYIHTYIHT
jgi:hypothetical protein